MKKETLYLILFSFWISSSYCQRTRDSGGWTTNNPFQTDVFVENFGQFNSWAASPIPIKFAINSSDKIFFTQQGVIFKLEKFDNVSDEEREKQEKGESIDTTKRIFFVAMNWEGCNPNAEIVANEASEAYYTFGEKGYENVKAKGFRKLLYKNLYPNIDLEYIIPKKGGIKYKLILHPGANVGLLKMHYSGDVEEIRKDKEGNIVIETLAGEITDHAPKSYYEDGNSKISSSFLLNGNTVSFQIQTKSIIIKTAIVDPWTTTPTSLVMDSVALDIDFDDFGNVYISGGPAPRKLVKYSNNGILIWTFTNPYTWNQNYSKFCVLPNSGTSYIGEGLGSGGSRIMKINLNGTLEYTTPYLGVNNEIWSMSYNRCNKQLIAFGGGTNSNHNIKIIADTNLSSSTSKCFNGISGNFNDIASAIIDNNGDFFAITTSQSNFPCEGKLQKSLLSTNYSAPCAFAVQTGYTFNEIVLLQGTTTVSTVRANALAVNNNYVFSYDGQTLKAWNKVNGNTLDSIIVDVNYAAGSNRTHEGIDVDDCNYIYVGGANQVHVYSFNGITFSTLPSITSNITDEVHGVKLNRNNGNLYVCGLNFVTELNAPISCFPVQFSSVIIVDSCAGNAYISATGGFPPYHYQWSNGSLDSCILNVPPNIYSVTISDNSCGLTIFVDTLLVNHLFQLSLSPTTQTICEGDSISLLASSNNVGANFIWSNGLIGDSIRIAPFNTTTLNVNGSFNSCSDTASAIIIVNPTPHIVLHPIICGEDVFSVGPHDYTISGTYYDTLQTSFGCDSTIITHLIVNPLPTTPIITQTNDTLTSTSPFGNQWYNQNGILVGDTNQSLTLTVNGDYYVIVTLNGCVSDTSNVLHVTNVGIGENDKKSNFNIYPNPVTNELIIEAKGNKEKIEFEILNSLGQVVFKGSLIEKIVVQTKNFAQGMYVVKLGNGKRFEFRKVVKSS